MSWDLMLLTEPCFHSHAGSELGAGTSSTSHLQLQSRQVLRPFHHVGVKLCDPLFQNGRERVIHLRVTSQTVVQSLHAIRDPPSAYGQGSVRERASMSA